MNELEILSNVSPEKLSNQDKALLAIVDVIKHYKLSVSGASKVLEEVKSMMACESSAFNGRDVHNIRRDIFRESEEIKSTSDYNEVNRLIVSGDWAVLHIYNPTPETTLVTLGRIQ